MCRGENDPPKPTHRGNRQSELLTDGVPLRERDYTDRSAHCAPRKVLGSEQSLRCVAAPADDPRIIEKSGKALDLAEVAIEYGLGGRRRPSPGATPASLTRERRVCVTRALVSDSNQAIWTNCIARID